jgi:hypothetical protein
VSQRLDRLRAAVEAACGCTATHEESYPVTETFRGEVVWEGMVERFNLDAHPTAKSCYAFYLIEGDEPIFQTVLGIPPIDSPIKAVRAAIAARSSQLG